MFVSMNAALNLLRVSGPGDAVTGVLTSFRANLPNSRHTHKRSVSTMLYKKKMLSPVRLIY